VDVTLNGRSIPAKIEPEADNRYHVSFVPVGSGVYTVRVYYAGVEVTGPATIIIIAFLAAGLFRQPIQPPLFVLPLPLSQFSSLSLFFPLYSVLFFSQGRTNAVRSD